jgi:NADH:ubiquinone oxidoreductase subunit K
MRKENMNQTFAEILLSVSVAINAAQLMFIVGVLRKVTNDMDASAFKHFLGSLRAGKVAP